MVNKDEKYMIQAVNNIAENCSSFMHNAFDDVKSVGTDFHADAEKMTIKEALADLNKTVEYFQQCYKAEENENMEPTALMDMVIAAAIVFKKLV